VSAVRIEVLHDGYRSGRDVDLDAASDAELGRAVRELARNCAEGKARVDESLADSWADPLAYYRWRAP
jgi:hypothetical protein